MHYTAPWWLPGGNLQTIWPALQMRHVAQPGPVYQRERWTTPDADFIDVDTRAGQPGKPLLVLFHGLEGSSQSHYARAFADYAAHQQWSFAVPHFRGCSGEINLAPRAYHSGDFEEVGWILQRLRAQHTGPMLALGISLGANALLRWAQEMGAQAATVVQALAALSSPIDLAAGGGALGRGFNRRVYTRMFLNTMKPKALIKWAQFPGLFDRQAMLAAQDLYAFDNVFTAPLHGFRDTDDYWCRASAKPRLHEIRVPTLVVNARNDPFVPAWCLPHAAEVGPSVTLWQPAQGGHSGFVRTHASARDGLLPDAVGAWLTQCLPQAAHG